jgi:hypothetical protein
MLGFVGCGIRIHRHLASPPKEKAKIDKTAPRGAGTMYNRIVEGGVLARAAQQRKQLGAQRQARNKRAGNGKKQRGNDESRGHGKDYKDFISGAQQFSDPGTPRCWH